jgi:hypothetical protein
MADFFGLDAVNQALCEISRLLLVDWFAGHREIMAISI